MSLETVESQGKAVAAGTDAPLPDIARGVEGRAELRPMWKIVGDYKPADVRDRLIKMKPCEGEVVVSYLNKK